MKRFICWLFGHKFQKEFEQYYVRTGHCKRCKKKMWGAYMKGELTGLMFWTYTIGDIESNEASALTNNKTK